MSRANARLNTKPTTTAITVSTRWSRVAPAIAPTLPRIHSQFIGSWLELRPIRVRLRVHRRVRLVGHDMGTVAHLLRDDVRGHETDDCLLAINDDACLHVGVKEQ